MATKAKGKLSQPMHDFQAKYQAWKAAGSPPEKKPRRPRWAEIRAARDGAEE